MKETKKQVERFAFYDKGAIEKKMEAMAEQGWMIEQPGNYLWIYRRTQPRRLHFSVTYFPCASDFDPGPTEGQRQMEEFCAQDGWVPAARWGQMQIFYNEQDNPIPIETDPVTQVAILHQAAKKNMLPLHCLQVALCLYQLLFTGWRLLKDPVEFLADPSSLLMFMAWMLILFPALWELGWYFHWYRKAKTQAERGLFYEMKPHYTASWVLLGVSLFLIILALHSIPGGKWFLLIWGGAIAAICAVVWMVKKGLKKKGASRNVNRILSFGTSIFLTLFLLTALTVAVLRSGFSGAKKPVDTYSLNGWEMDVYADAMPLYVQELTETSCAAWSTEACKTCLLYTSRCV